MNKMHEIQTKNIIKIILTLLFFASLANWPYGYYQLVRFLGMVGFLILANYDKKRNVLFVLWICSAVLINPFIKISLGRIIWNIIDVIWGILLIVTMISEIRIKNKCS
jgi:hypothetical protein